MLNGEFSGGFGGWVLGWPDAGGRWLQEEKVEEQWNKDRLDRIERFPPPLHKDLERYGPFHTPPRSAGNGWLGGWRGGMWTFGLGFWVFCVGRDKLMGF